MYSSLRKCNTSSKGRLPTLSCDVSQDSDSSSAGSPISPTDGDMLRTGVPPCSREGSLDPLPARAEITIDILPEGVSCRCPGGDPACASEYHGSPLLSTGRNVSCSPSSKCSDVVPLSHRPRHLRTIDPTITFLSRSPISANSFFTVFSHEVAVYSEVSKLVLLDPPGSETLPDAEDTFFYTTTLVPSYWKTIIESAGGFRYIVRCR